MYLGGVLMPITPSKVTVKINNQNKTMTLINGEEIKPLACLMCLLNCCFPKFPILLPMAGRNPQAITFLCLSG